MPFSLKQNILFNLLVDHILFSLKSLYFPESLQNFYLILDIIFPIIEFKCSLNLEKKDIIKKGIW